MAGFMNGGQKVVDIKINGSKTSIDVEKTIDYMSKHPEATPKELINLTEKQNNTNDIEARSKLAENIDNENNLNDSKSRNEFSTEWQEYMNYYQKEISSFNLDEFLLDDNTSQANGAVGVITPNQLVFTRTINSGRGPHGKTFDTLTSIMYNLPITDEFKINETNNKIYTISTEQNILIRMINEGEGEMHQRGLIFYLPDNITESQVEFLVYLEDRYKTLFQNISKTDGEPLIFFRTLDNKNQYCDSLTPLIEYAKSNLVTDNKKIISEENYMGITLNK